MRGLGKEPPAGEWRSLSAELSGRSTACP